MRINKMMGRKVTTVLLSLTLAACGGGSSNDPAATAIGQFKDSNTSGLNYVSGGQSGVTDSQGKFTYEVGKPVVFSVGGVTLGEAVGKSVVSPLDLVTDGNSASAKVQNIVRFLMALDTDGIPSNGITIAPSVQTVAKDWSSVDFTTSDLDNSLTTILAEAASADSGAHNLPTVNDAKSHLESTLRCAYSGAFKGNYTGGDSGNVGALISASDGSVTGLAFSNFGSSLMTLSGSNPINYGQDVSFVSGNSSAGATFTGQFSSVNQVSGTWNNTNTYHNGQFTGSRVGGIVDAKYRFTGNFLGDNSGYFTFDVGDSNNITGIAYDVQNDELHPLTGSVDNNNVLSATVSNGTSITGALNASSGSLSGTWNNSTAQSSGSFSGNGCRLN